MIASAQELRINPGRGRVVLGVVGALVGLVSAALLATGGTVVWVHESKRDSAGFYATTATTISTPTAALVSDGLDVDADGAEWLFRQGRLATIRIAARAAGGKPVFVGIGPRSQVTEYLQEVEHDEITDFGVDPFKLTRARRVGTAAAADPPATKDFWTAESTGAGAEALTWPVTAGDWSVVVMNEDGSRGVRTSLSVAARVPLVLWVGIGLLAAGGLAGLVALAALLAARRRRPGR